MAIKYIACQKIAAIHLVQLNTYQNVGKLATAVSASDNMWPDKFYYTEKFGTKRKYFLHLANGQIGIAFCLLFCFLLPLP